MIAEVLDEDGARTPDGSLGGTGVHRGFLFVQAQPLVRYLTGDIVERLPCVEPWRARFRWWGRDSAQRQRLGARRGPTDPMRRCRSHLSPAWPIEVTWPPVRTHRSAADGGPVRTGLTDVRFSSSGFAGTLGC